MGIELKIGEEVAFDGVRVICREHDPDDNPCRSCAFYEVRFCYDKYKCSEMSRSDRKSVYFEKI